MQICFSLRLSLSARFRCPRRAKTLTSSGETTPHKTSLKVGPAVKLKAFTHLAAHTADMIISHRVWAQFSIPFSLASQRPLLFHAQTGRQAGRHTRLYLHAVPAQQHQASHRSEQRGRKRSSAKGDVSLRFRVCLVVGAQQSTSMNAKSSGLPDSPLPTFTTQHKQRCIGPLPCFGSAVVSDTCIQDRLDKPVWARRPSTRRLK